MFLQDPTVGYYDLYLSGDFFFCLFLEGVVGWSENMEEKTVLVATLTSKTDNT